MFESNSLRYKIKAASSFASRLGVCIFIAAAPAERRARTIQKRYARAGPTLSTDLTLAWIRREIKVVAELWRLMVWLARDLGCALARVLFKESSFERLGASLLGRGRGFETQQAFCRSKRSGCVRRALGGAPSAFSGSRLGVRQLWPGCKFKSRSFLRANRFSSTK